MSSIIQDEFDEFATSSPREVAYNLRQLVKAGERVSVVFDDGSETFLTVLIDVDEDIGVLYFDWGGSEAINQKFLKSERNFFVCSPAGIRNQFVVGKVWEVRIEDRRAFATRLPQRYLRLQRRDFFRLTLPITQRPKCSLHSEQHQEEHEYTAVDIGIGGVGFEMPGGSFNYVPGEILTGARIELGTFGRVIADLNMRYTTQLTRGGRETARMGCGFVNLSNAGEHALQKFLTHVQREIKARAI